MPTAGCRTVLVVDDSADVRLSLELLLRMRGYAVATAADGAEALAWLRAHGDDPPCVVVLDLRMPGMGGAAFRAAQLADPALAAIPVVVYSGEGDLATRRDLGDVAVWRKGDAVAGLLSLIAARCP